MPATETPEKPKRVRKKKDKLFQANQHISDPRQNLFLGNYLNPQSETFSNALQSALKAGYTQEYSESLTAQMPSWLSEALGSQSMLAKAERNLDELLDLPSMVPAMGAFGPITRKIPTGEFKDVLNKKTGEVEQQEIMKEEPLYVLNSKLISIKADTSKFIAERLGRNKYGAKKEETMVPGTLVQNFTQININPPKEEPVHTDVHNA